MMARRKRSAKASTGQTPEQAVEAGLRAMKHLPEDGDLSLIILKGHLLIEELLFTVLRSAVRHPESISSANLSFYNAASVAKALFNDGHFSELWDAIFALNTLRNTLAHNLDPPDLEAKLRSFAHAGSGGSHEAEELLMAAPSRVMVSSIQTMCGALLAMIRHGAGERRN